ncbi:type IX secretion system membrane protein PorP/SprF [Flavobacteriaceae bacterium]|nr:type IX secretion system membrane protein PorP/SprF [Flavobacteriaceae bacterium]
MFFVFVLVISLGYPQKEGMQLLFPHQFNAINPARIGLTEEIYLGADFSTRWLGINQAPAKQSIYFEIPIHFKKITYGGLITNFNNFNENQIAVIGQFSFWVKLRKNTFLRLGIKAGLKNFNINFEGLQSVDSVSLDPLLKQYSFFYPNLGIGGYLKFKTYFVSIAFPRLLQHVLKIEYEEEFHLTDRFIFLIRSGWQQQLGYSQWNLKFSGMVFNKNSKTDFQLQSSIHNKFGAFFLSYQSQKIVGIGVILHEKKMISVSYGYEFGIRSKKNLNVKNNSLSLFFRLGNN